MERRSRGFTLMEVLVAMLLMTIVIAAIFSAYRYQMFALKGQDIQLDTQEAGRGIIDIMTREIRMTGYNPRCLVLFPGITDARPQLLQVQFDLNENGTTTDPATDAGEIVTYSFDATSGAVQRSTGGTPVPLISGMSPDAFGFKYYDGNGAELTPSGSPPALIAADLTRVRRVRVTLQLQRANLYQAGSSPLGSNFVSNIDLRNRFINGGAGCS